MAADIPLCRSGGLDLDSVKRQWGLETCLVSSNIAPFRIPLPIVAQPVDPLRWKPFQPTHPNYLSAVAVEVLSYGQDCIKVIGAFPFSPSLAIPKGYQNRRPRIKH
jgi:hypothetical protein